MIITKFSDIPRLVDQSINQNISIVPYIARESEAPYDGNRFECLQSQ